MEQGALAGSEWSSVVQPVLLPANVREASKVDLYMEGFPPTASWRIDDIWLGDRGQVSLPVLVPYCSNVYRAPPVQ